MAHDALVSDELWEAIAPYLPPERPKPKGGRPRLPDRAVLAGIVFVLRHGQRWRDLPRELGYGSGVTCWRRLRAWQALGGGAAVHRTLPNGPAPAAPGQAAWRQRRRLPGVAAGAAAPRHRPADRPARRGVRRAERRHAT